MKNNHFYIIILCTLVVNALSAQSSSSLSLGWGMGNLKRQDLTFSPMIHRSWSPVNFVLEYNRSKKLEQSVLVKFANYKAIVGEQFDYISFYSGKESTYPHSFALVDIDYSLGKKIVDKERWNFTLGGRSRNRLQPSSYTFGNFNSFGYYFSLGLDLWMQFRYDPSERHHVSAHLAAPILSWNARSSYLWHTDEYLRYNYSHNGFKAFMNYLKGGEIQSWGNAQSVDFDVQYCYSISDKWDVGGRYMLSMNFNQDPTHFSQVENVIYLTGTLKF